MVLPLDEGTFNENHISNFPPVSILTTFSKIYEGVIKKLIDIKIMDKYYLLSLLLIDKIIVPNMF